jgi:hypothetical protein
MAFTTPATVVAGTAATASYANTYIRDNIAWLATDSPACRVYNSANESISNTTDVAVTFNSERYDNAAVHSTSSNTSRLTIPTGGGGKYLVGASWQWALSAAGNYRQAKIKQNASTFVAFQTSQPSASHASEATICALDSYVATDYAELYAKQDSGGALNLTVAANYAPEFWCLWLRT